MYFCEICGEELIECIDYVPFGNSVTAMKTYYCLNECSEEDNFIEDYDV